MIEQKKRMKERRPFYSIFGLLVMSCLFMSSIMASPLAGVDKNKAILISDTNSVHLYMTLTADEAVYDLGDKVYLTAELIGGYSAFPPDAVVRAVITYPGNVEQEVIFTSPKACYSQVGDCSEGDLCNYESSYDVHCPYTYTARLSESGKYTVKAYLVDTPSVTAITSFSVTEVDNRYKLSVNTDKAVYGVGEEVELTASFSGLSDLNFPEKINAAVSLPTEMSQLVYLNRGLCASGACECPTGEVCDCVDVNTICYYDASFKTYLTGKHIVTAVAEIEGESIRAKTDFVTKESSEYVYARLGSSFELLEGQTAVIVDYRDLKITLDAITAACSVEQGCSYLASITTSLGDINSEFSLNDGETEEFENLQITAQGIESDSVTFVVKNNVADIVDIKISPVSAHVEAGSVAEYLITVKDKHASEYQPWSSRLYAYDLKLVGLPFLMKLDDAVTLAPGESKELLLSVDTSKMLRTYESINADNSVQAVETTPIQAVEATPVQAVEAIQVGSASAVAPKGKLARVQVSAVAVDRPVAVQIASAERVKGQDDSNLAKITVAEADSLSSGRRYEFRVEVFERGEDTRSDVAYAKLFVYSEPPHIPDISIPIYSGWNLVSLPGVGTLDEGSCGTGMHAFVYLSEYGRYVPLREASGLLGEDKLNEYLRLHSFWVYSYEDCRASFELETETSLSEISLDAGWNFVPIPAEMLGQQLSDFSSDCSLEKSYIWDAEEQDWEQIRPSYTFTDSDVYSGFITEAEEYCEFGWGVLISPPSLPQ